MMKKLRSRTPGPHLKFAQSTSTNECASTPLLMRMFFMAKSLWMRVRGVTSSGSTAARKPLGRARNTSISSGCMYRPSLDRRTGVHLASNALRKSKESSIVGILRLSISGDDQCFAWRFAIFSRSAYACSLVAPVSSGTFVELGKSSMTST